MNGFGPFIVEMPVATRAPVLSVPLVTEITLGAGCGTVGSNEPLRLHGAVLRSLILNAGC